MQLTQKRRSLEPCTESGWDAFDYLTLEPIAHEDILALEPLGSLTYLTMLKKPFFKLDADYYHVKGTRGEQVLRIAVHRGHMEQLDALEAQLFANA